MPKATLEGGICVAALMIDAGSGSPWTLASSSQHEGEDEAG